MKNKLFLTESERNRILGLHKVAIKKEFLFEQRMDAEGKNVEMYNNDKDYDYKKEGDKYYFKLKATPKSDEAQAYKKQGKFANWTAAKPGPGLDAIKALPFQAVAPPPPNTDGSDETFDAPVQTIGTTTTSTYPWIENGKASFEALKKSYVADPNFNKFLEKLKNLSQDQIEKIKQDFKAQNFPTTAVSYSAMMNAFYDAKRFKSTTPEASTASTGTIDALTNDPPRNSQPTAPVSTNTPVKYPWIGADGRESLQSIETALKTDPNLQKFLRELRKLSADQLRTVQQDLRNFYVRMSSANMDPMSNQGYLIADQTVKDAIKILKKASEGAS
jgi:hypothetical protein